MLRRHRKSLSILKLRKKKKKKLEFGFTKKASVERKSSMLSKFWFLYVRLSSEILLPLKMKLNWMKRRGNSAQPLIELERSDLQEWDHLCFFYYLNLVFLFNLQGVDLISNLVQIRKAT